MRDPLRLEVVVDALFARILGLAQVEELDVHVFSSETKLRNFHVLHPHENGRALARGRFDLKRCSNQFTKTNSSSAMVGGGKLLALI